jgi:hypothetical protein
MFSQVFPLFSSFLSLSQTRVGEIWDTNGGEDVDDGFWV